MGCGVYTKEDIYSKMLEIKLEREQIRKDRELAFKEYEILYGEDLYYSRKPVEDYIYNKPPKKKKKKMKTIVYSYSDSKSNDNDTHHSINEEEEKANNNLRVFLRNKTLKKTLKMNQENNNNNDDINDNEKNNSEENKKENINREKKKNFTELSNNYLKMVNK